MFKKSVFALLTLALLLSLAACTSLHQAARDGDLTAVNDMLMDETLDVNAPDEVMGNTPLHEAAIAGRSAVAQALIAAGANVDARNEPDLTPLHYAAMTDNVTVAQILASNGGQVNAKSFLGYTPLHYAAMTGSPEMVQFLIEQNANIDAQTNAGETPLQLATAKGRNQSAQILRGRMGQ